MSEQYPFLALSKKYNSREGFSSFAPDGSTKPEVLPSTAGQSSSAQYLPLGTSEVHAFYDAALTGVQDSFGHLSKDDIAYPPHQWLDARLARQIALHMMNEHFGIPRRKIVLELERSRTSVARAMRKVGERMENMAFADAYEVMTEVADKALEEDKS